MNCITKLISHNRSLLTSETCIFDHVRGKAKKAMGSSRNPPKHPRPKHRGWKVQDGHYVSQGTILATQRTLRWFPGLNVGFGKNGTLMAMEHGQVAVTCEQVDADWDHTWVQRLLSHRQGQVFYKKYFNVLPLPQHQRFKLIEEV